MHGTVLLHVDHFSTITIIRRLLPFHFLCILPTKTVSNDIIELSGIFQ